MNSTISIRFRSLAIALLALVGLMGAYLLGSFGHPTAASAAPATVVSTDSAQPHTIAMTGVGTVSAVPDQVSFHLRATGSGPDVDTALHAASTAMRRVQAALVQQGVKRVDMKTTGLDIHAVYRYPADAAPVVTGYAASEDVAVLVRSLGNAGKALSAAVAAGGNGVRVHGLTLQVGDLQALQKKARDLAVREATAKARQYAAATGDRLGDVISIAEVHAAAPRPVPVFGAASAMKDLARVPIRAGTTNTKVTVEVKWALNPA